MFQGQDVVGGEKVTLSGLIGGRPIVLNFWAGLCPPCRAEMPDLQEFCHYRSIDVTSVKELSTRWYPNERQFRKPTGHRALDDIKGSIQELAHYRQSIFKP